ncbi:MAG: phage tail tape measure protein [bacterium]|nr:phage tail tape measure protein [bacterium]
MPSASGIRAGRAFVELGINDKFTAGLKKAQARLQAFGAGVKNLGLQLLKVTGAAAIPLAVSTRIFTGFDDRMRVVRAVTQATEQDFAKLREEAKRLGRTTSFTASQVANAMVELGRAGFDPTQILGMTEAMLALSRATDTELPRATEIAGAALRGFNLEADQMGRVTDVLTAGANKSAQTLEDLFEALKPVAPLAEAAGESIEDTTAAIGILANNGIKGSLAGNALARAFKNLSTEAKQTELGKLGVEAVTAIGDLRPLADILNDLAEQSENLGSAQRLSLFETLFGRGQAAALKLASGGKAFKTLANEIRASTGIALKTSKQMEQGIGGVFRRLYSAAEGVGIAIGEAIEKPLSRVAEVITGFVGRFSEWVAENQRTIVTVTAIVVGVGALGAGLVSLGIAAQVAAFVFGGLASILVAVKVVLGTMVAALAALVSPIGLVIATVGTLGAVFALETGIAGKAVAWLGETFSWLRDRVMTVVRAIADALAAGEIGLAAQVLWAGLKVAWYQGVEVLTRVWQGAKRIFVQTATDMWYGALTAAENVWHALSIGWTETTAFLSKTWEGFTSFLTDTWDTVGYLLTTSWNKIKGVFDETFDAAAANLAAAEELVAKLEKTDAARQARLAELQARRKQQREAADEVHEATLLEIAKAWAEAEKKINEAGAASSKKAREELEAAKKALAEAIAKVKGIGEAGEKEAPIQPAGEPTKRGGGGKGGLAGVGEEARGGAIGSFDVSNIQSQFAAAGRAFEQVRRRHGGGIAARSAAQVAQANKRTGTEVLLQAINDSNKAMQLDVMAMKRALLELESRIGTA